MGRRDGATQVVFTTLASQSIPLTGRGGRVTMELIKSATVINMKNFTWHSSGYILTIAFPLRNFKGNRHGQFNR